MGDQPKKTFDAIEMSRRLRRETGERLSKMTAEERVAYLNARIEHHRKTGSWFYSDTPASEVVREDPPAP